MSARADAGSDAGSGADSLERMPVLGPLVAGYRYIQLNMPRTVSAAGALLMAGLAAVHVYELVEPSATPGVREVPVYYRVWLGVLAAASIAAAGAISAWAHRRVTRIGWGVGTVVGLVTLAGYLASRIVGLPGMALWRGRWDYPLGTLAMALAAATVVTAVAVATRLAIAMPDTRHWQD